MGTPETSDASEASETPARSAGANWGEAARRGAIAFVIVALVGQVIAWMDFLLLPGAVVDLGAVGKVGAFYLAMFHRAPLEFGLSGMVGTINVNLAIAPGLGTLFVVWLLYRSGRGLAVGSGEADALRRGLVAMRIAPVYAGLVFVVAAAVSVTPFSLDVMGSRVTLVISAILAFVLPLVLAAAATFLGGFLSAPGSIAERWPWGARLRAWLVGGWRMFVALMVLTVVGLLVVTVARPDDSKVYFAGFHAIAHDGGVVAGAHNLLLLPNETIWIAVPAMGGCDGIRGFASLDFVCLTKFPSGTQTPTGAPEVQPEDPVSGLLGAIPSFDGPPYVYGVFLLAPLLAGLFGGAGAARRAGALSRRRDAALVGAGAGVVFAVLIGLASVFAGANLTTEAALGPLGEAGGLSVGPRPWTGMAFALIWGVVAGAIGGAVWGRAGSVPGGLDEQDAADAGGEGADDGQEGEQGAGGAEPDAV